MHITDTLHCIAEANMILKSNYAPKKTKYNHHCMYLWSVNAID